MSQDACILTTKDFTILEIMLERCLGQDDPLRPLLQRKMNGAVVMFRDDVPEDVATLSSRVTFRVDGGAEDSRILTTERETGPVGMCLAITQPRGLALLGLSAGQELVLPSPAGGSRVRLEQVLYQPEAARRHRAWSREAPAAPARPSLRLVHGSGTPKACPARLPAGAFDDPGPSAA